MEAETPGKDAAPALTGEALQAKVQEGLESLLSKKNLVRDQFLASNMNPQMYIPLRILMSHDKMKALGATEEHLAAAATASHKLGIDDEKTMVRPLLKSKRNVIILRDMPDGTSEDEVKGIFANCPHAAKLVSVKAEVNNTWFVKFNLDEGTQEVVLWLRSQKFKGQPINASIKSEHFLRSFFPLHTPAMPDGMGFPMDGGMGFPMGFPPGPADMMFMDGKGMDGGKGGWDDGGKGMMMPMMEMPMASMGGIQLPGSWQPWGKRHQPPPMILPLKYPEKPKEGEKGGEKEGKGDGKGSKGKEGGGDKWGNEKWGNEKWGNDNWSSNKNWGGENSWGGDKWGNSGKWNKWSS